MGDILGKVAYSRLKTKRDKNNDFPTIALFGDSITSQNGIFEPDSGNKYYQTIGYFSWANLRANGHFDVVREAGTGGNTTAQMLARIQTDIIDYKPEWCVIYGGINDIYDAGPILATTTIANLTTMYTMLRSAGIKIIIATITPSLAINTADELLRLGTVNEFIVNYAVANSIANKDVILVDWFQCLADTDAKTINASFSSDGTHPNALGAWRMGKKMFECLDKYFNFTENNLLGKTNTQLNNLLVNPTLQGTTNGKATSWSFQGTTGKTYTKEYYDDGTISFNEQCIDASVAGGAADTYMYQSVATGFSEGDFVEGLIRIRFENVTTITYCAIAVTCNTGLKTLTLIGDDLSPTLILADAVYRTPKLRIPAGITSIEFSVITEGLTGKIKVSNPTLRKVT